MIRFSPLMKYALLIGAMVLSVVSSAQQKLAGHVYEAESGKGADAVNVLLQKAENRAILRYALTEPDGSFSLDVPAGVDSLIVSVSGFNVISQSKKISSFDEDVVFRISYARQSIREVKIQADPIARHRDTLTYYVEMFRDSTDQSIGDVLQRLPGIQVSESGMIQYNGREINRLYIEGMDMLGGQYGIATNNVQAKDIATVELYENHQPVKVLQDWVRSDQAALNLRLKQGAKGVWNGVLALGTGYRPWLWDVAVAPMLFTRKFQTILTYKTNNTGENVSRELVRQFDGLSSVPTLMGVLSPVAPPLDEKAWLDNHVHAASANMLFKLGKDDELTLKASFVHDRQDASSISETVFYTSVGPYLRVVEPSKNTHRVDNAQMELNFRHNAPRLWLSNNLIIEGDRKKDRGELENAGPSIGQEAILPLFNLDNRLNAVRRFGLIQVNMTSDFALSRRNSKLEITPGLYPDIMDGEQDLLIQTVEAERLRFRNSVSTSYRFRSWTAGIALRAGWDREKLDSRLAAADSMQNHLTRNRLDLQVSPSLSYAFGSSFNLDMVSPLTWSQSGNQPFFLYAPSIGLKYIPVYEWTFRAMASHTERIGSLFEEYGGYIMNNYRTVISRGGQTNRTHSSNMNLSAAYSNAPHALFLSVSGEGWNTNSDLSYGTVYSGILSRMVVYPAPQKNSGIRFSSDVNKRFPKLSTTVKLGMEWIRTWSDYYRQGQPVSVIGDQWVVNFSGYSRIRDKTLLSYSNTYTRRRSRLDSGADITPIWRFQQRASLYYLPRSNLKIGIGGRHFHDSGIQGSGKDMMFADVQVTLKKGRVEYSLEGNNLFGAKEYTATSYDEMILFTQSYQLRPIYFLFKMRFSIR